MEVKDQPTHQVGIEDQNRKRMQQIMNRAEEAVQNILSERYALQRRMNSFMDPRRDIYEECGFPSEPTTSEQYNLLYERDPIAARVIEVYPEETWGVQPTVYEKGDQEATTPFEKEWDELGGSLSITPSYYKDEKGSVIWSYLKRLDEVSGIGRYGVLLVGIDDGKPLDEPVDGYYPIPDFTGQERTIEEEIIDQLASPSLNPIPGGSKGRVKRKLTSLRVFPEHLAKVIAVETDQASPRYMYPVMYQITISDPRVESAAIGANTATLNVHWTRVLHVADGLKTHDVYAPPRCRAVLNNLISLQKIYGADGEMFWLAGIPLWSFETQTSLGGDVDVNDEQFRDAMEKLWNGLQRYIRTSGLNAKAMTTQVADPTNHINIHIEAICIKLNIPKRIFSGSERGELASSQDEGSWKDKVKKRQDTHATPHIIVAFINMLINMGVLTPPGEDGFHVRWPDVTATSAGEKATILLQRAQAIAAFNNGNGVALMSELDFLTEEMGYDDDEAQRIYEASLESLKRKLDMQMEQMKAQAALNPSPVATGPGKDKPTTGLKGGSAGGPGGKPMSPPGKAPKESATK